MDRKNVRQDVIGKRQNFRIIQVNRLQNKTLTSFVLERIKYITGKGENAEFVFGWFENIAGKGENECWLPAFSLLPTIFSNVSRSKSLKVGIMWPEINLEPDSKVLDSSNSKISSVHKLAPLLPVHRYFFFQTVNG